MVWPTRWEPPLSSVLADGKSSRVRYRSEACSCSWLTSAPCRGLGKRCCRHTPSSRPPRRAWIGCSRSSTPSETVGEARDARPLPTNGSRGGAHLVFEDVAFGYEPNRPVLQGINLEVFPGETIALVGPTGAGKSTFVSLILRFFDPCEGRILFNGVDLRQATLDSLRGQISIVLQEPFLLPFSIADNIAYGCPGATREQVVAAAEAANAHEFIVPLPHGYDTVIGERGATLSGGQKQRLAIARALVRDTPVVILDEPTSALDTETESQLLDALERLSAGRTTFIIAHRLSTIRGADRIVVLDRGRIAATGDARRSC